MSDEVPRKSTTTRGEAAALLLDSRRNRFFLPFLACERGVSEAAASLGVGKSLVSYWIGQLRRVGLIEPVPGEGRRRRYRSCADVYEVPLESVPLESADQILSVSMDPFYARLKRSLLRAALRFGPWHYRLERTPAGPMQTILPVHGSLAAAGIVNARSVLHLTAEEASRLRAELDDVVLRYRALSRPGEAGRKAHLSLVCTVEDAG